MIDLHTHTTHSDGSDDTITLLKKAEEAKLEYLSITDHSTCKAYEDIKNIDISKYYTGKLITGCELFSMVDGTTIELLGYNVDTNFMNRKLPKLYNCNLQELEIEKFNANVKMCEKLGIIIDIENIKFNPKIDFASRAIWREIVKDEQNKKIFDNERAWDDRNVFYRECICNPNSKFFVDRTGTFPEPKEVMAVIREAGGLVFIPHVFVYGENSNKVLNELTKNHAVDGIECYYSLFSEEQSKYLIDFCKENHYYMSGGSDYHGTRKPEITLGIGKGNLNIPSNIIEKWAK